MMIAKDFLLLGPGESVIDTNCMESHQGTPTKEAEFYSCPQEDWCLQCGMSYLQGWEFGCGTGGR
jgi:hypothetical protein